MAGEGALPSELWLISCDGLASFKWRLNMLNAYLPNLDAYIARVSAADAGFRAGADSAIGIMVEGVSSDVLGKIDEYMRLVADICTMQISQSHRLMTTATSVYAYYDDWFLDFFTNLDADMMRELNTEAEKRKAQQEAAGAAPPEPEHVSAMQLLADITAYLCSICVDQQRDQARTGRNSDYDILLFKMVTKMRFERGNARGYFGNV